MEPAAQSPSSRSGAEHGPDLGTCAFSTARLADTRSVHGPTESSDFLMFQKHSHTLNIE